MLTGSYCIVLQPLNMLLTSSHKITVEYQGKYNKACNSHTQTLDHQALNALNS